MPDVLDLPKSTGLTIQFGETTLPEIVLTVSVSTKTTSGTFSTVAHLLSNRPLRRPARRRRMSNEELKRVAAENPPPEEWYAKEEDRPF